MSRARRGTPPLGESNAAISSIVALLERRTGTDFSAYRTATLERRIRNRMISLGISDLGVYLERLRDDASEPDDLLARITIKVSRFYRNRVTFDALREHVVPTLAQAAGPRPLRVWSAGCAFGEEPYTLAMLLDEAGRDDGVYATDLDPRALEKARLATYPAEAVGELPVELRQRYLEPVSGRHGPAYRVRDFLRERVTFERHDLRAGAPSTAARSFDLICCRNVLIYLERRAQLAAFAKLREHLAPAGALCLGEAEWPPTAHCASLASLGRKTRIFLALDEAAGRSAA